MRVSSPIPHKRARIEIIPLIDIMFFLLASFMMVSLSQVHMKGIRVNLPASVTQPQPTPPIEKEFTRLFVDADGLVHFDNETVLDGDVTPRLLQLYNTNHDVKVFVSGDREALHGEVIKLLDRVRSAGIQKVGYEIKVKHIPGGGAPGAPGAAPPPPPPPPPPPSP
jgi:biopolymer transport protein ExbD